MKKITKVLLACVLIGAIVFSFAACSSKKDAETTAPAAAEQEDGQNPVMNFIGKYDNGGTFITVAAKGNNDAEFTVEEPMTDTEKYTYTFSGTLDLDTLKVTYSNSTKTVQTLGEYGKVVEEKIEYSDGAGVVIFRDDGTLEWQDENEAERMIDNTVFTYVLTQGS